MYIIRVCVCFAIFVAHEIPQSKKYKRANYIIRRCCCTAYVFVEKQKKINIFQRPSLIWYVSRGLCAWSSFSCFLAQNSFQNCSVDERNLAHCNPNEMFPSGLRVVESFVLKSTRQTRRIECIIFLIKDKKKTISKRLARGAVRVYSNRYYFFSSNTNNYCSRSCGEKSACGYNEVVRESSFRHIS